MIKKYLFWIITIAVFLSLYHPVLNTYFTQDDFFHFKVAQTDGSFRGLIYLIGFHPFEERGIAFYRPLFRDLLYHFSYVLFSLNQFPMRILSFVLHLTNAFLISKLIYKLFKNKFHAYFTAFFYTITASNVATLYYLAGGIQVLGALTFILLTLLNFINYLDVNNKKYLLFTYITFLLALASHEQSFILPFLLTGMLIIYKHKVKTIHSLKVLIPFFLILAVYLFLNYKIIGYSKNELQYQTLIDPKRTLNSLIWYSGWAMGLPEMLIDFAPSIFKLDPRLMRFWGNYFRIILPAFFISLSILNLIAIKLFLKNKKFFQDKRVLFLILWYLLGLLPVIFLPFHKSGHYLTVVLPAFWGIVGYFLSNYYESLKNKRSILPRTIILILSLITLSSTSSILGKNFFWASERGRLAEKIISQIMDKYPSLPKGARLFIKNDPNYPYVAEDWGGSSKQVYFILNGSDALQLLYKDNSLNVIYEDINKIDKYQTDFVFTPKIY